ncbi:MAG: response regulator [Leptospiraceae bacterium]|nr:response regulator [Leptospiraceae bacterium]MCB1321159.1 response regulator [Leptospiraceae bacterium]
MEKGYFVCVDDEVSVLETLREQLREHFGETHEVEVASSAEEALNLIDEIQGTGGLIEVIITDQVMPGMKGDRFLEEIHRRHPDTIKILLTGQAGLDSAIHAVNYGGLNRYVEKPWNFDTLRKDIEELINKFKQNIENQRMLNNLENRVRLLEEENQRLRHTEA